MKKDVAKEFIKIKEFPYEETLEMVKKEAPEFLAQYITKINRVYNLLIDKANNRYKAIKDLEKHIITLNNEAQRYFDFGMDSFNEKTGIEAKYNKALELLKDYNMPCDIDEFNIKNADYCSMNCSVDEEVYKKCWDRYIEQELKNEEI